MSLLYTSKRSLGALSYVKQYFFSAFMSNWQNLQHNHTPMYHLGYQSCSRTVFQQNKVKCQRLLGSMDVLQKFLICNNVLCDWLSNSKQILQIPALPLILHVTWSCANANLSYLFTEQAITCFIVIALIFASTGFTLIILVSVVPLIFSHFLICTNDLVWNPQMD